MKYYIAFVATATLIFSFINHLKTKSIMNKQERFDQALARMDEATTEIANDLKNLRSEIAAGSVTDESLAKLEANIATLDELGKDPENPVPETPTPEEGEGTENEETI